LKNRVAGTPKSRSAREVGSGVAVTGATSIVMVAPGSSEAKLFGKFTKILLLLKVTSELMKPGMLVEANVAFPIFGAASFITRPSKVFAGLLAKFMPLMNVITTVEFDTTTGTKPLARPNVVPPEEMVAVPPGKRTLPTEG
jgi:hypothetical protein